jgi:glucose-6-phosphate dehydrogenase assembly protein OpcA
MNPGIDPPAVEREMRAIEKEMAPEETRTSLFNLVIFSERKRAEDSDRVLSHLLGRRPARVIHVHLSERGETSVSVSARCSPDQTGRSVCFQEVVITSGKDGIGEDPGSWSPLLIRDIPVYLWYQERLEPLPAVLRQAEDFADKIIVDTGGPAFQGLDPLNALKRLHASGLPDRVSVADFAWRRFDSIRKIVAKFFDAPAMRQRLPEVTKMTVEGGPAAEVLLLLLWFSARMQWTPVERREGLLQFSDREGRPITAGHTEISSMAEGFRIRFATHDGETFGLSALDGDCMRNEPPGDEEPYTVPIRLPGDGELLLAEVDTLYHDWLYTEALTQTP